MSIFSMGAEHKSPLSLEICFGPFPWLSDLAFFCTNPFLFVDWWTGDPEDLQVNVGSECRKLSQGSSVSVLTPSSQHLR